VSDLPPSGTVLAGLAELDDPCAVLIDVGFSGVILTRVGDRVAAFRNRCPHAGYPMERPDGRIVVQEGRYMICSAHFASFRLEDGACAGGPCNGDGLERVAVDVRDGSICLA
jgi:nitrite reductase/ring-hydroxylating ferredoxin subunit